MSNDDNVITSCRPEPFDITNIKSLDEMKKEFGEQLESYMYTCIVEFLESLTNNSIAVYDLEKINQQLLTKLMFALCPTDHQLDDSYKQKFKEAILNNLDKDTDTIRKILRGIWDEQ